MKPNIMALGKHTIVEYFNCDTQNLNKINTLRQMMITAAQKAGATVIDTLFHGFSPYGITGVVIVAESHLSIHTWPEYGYAAVDIFTCGNSINNIKAIEYIKNELGSENYEIINLRRGRLPQENIIPELPSELLKPETI